MDRTHLSREKEMLREKEALPLPRSFYNASPEVVARKLLGRILVARSGGFQLAGRIVEVEAYLGVTDPAAHAFSGITPRNAVLFGEPGHAYVYFIYGMYSCLNVSCEPQGKAGCVLFRALEPLHLSVSNGDAGDPSAEEVLRRNRGLAPLAPARLIASGPGRLSQAFGITRASHNGVDLTSPASPLQIVDDDFRAGEIVATPRIGIRKAVEHPLRFYLAGNAFVSGKVSGRR